MQLHITDINLHFSNDCNALKVPVDFNPFWTCTGTLCIDLHQSYTLVLVSFPFSVPNRASRADIQSAPQSSPLSGGRGDTNTTLSCRV